MATKTENLNLTKPDQGDAYDVDDFNSNFKAIDDYAGDTQTNIEKVNSNVNNHTHNLGDNKKIVGILPINKGGTGATTASAAAQNLGINNKADKEHKHTADDITETDTKKIMTANERNKLGQLSRYCYIIAASDTDESLKKYANLKCTGKDDEASIHTLIDSIPAGSTIHMLAGTYKFSNPLRLFKAVNLIGSGTLTKLININGGYIISVVSSFVVVKDMQLVRYSSEMTAKSNDSLIEFYSLNSENISDVTIRGCILNYQNGEENAQGNIIAVNNPNRLKNLTQLRILENTFVYVKDSEWNGFDIDLSKVPTSMSAVAGANISNRGIKIKKKKGKAVYLYGQDTTVEEVE